jgi:hypothetical protein
MLRSCVSPFWLQRDGLTKSSVRSRSSLTSSRFRTRQRTADLLSGCHSASIERNCCPLLKVVWQRRTQYQDCRYRTAGPMATATRWSRAGTLGAASVRLEGSEACPLVLLQQSAQFGVIRSQRSLCVIHTAMVVDREDVRQAMRPGSAYATARDGHSVPIGQRACPPPASLVRFRAAEAGRAARLALPITAAKRGRWPSGVMIPPGSRTGRQSAASGRRWPACLPVR